MNKENTAQRNDYVTHSEFEGSIDKNELTQDKICGEVKEVRKEIVKQNVKIDDLNRKIERLLIKVNYSVFDNLFPDSFLLLLPFIVMLVLAVAAHR
ncbi:hypothetical protein NFX39_01520 [Fructobacillus sp. W13]|uniref:Uncharacterized protein n=1 Tax=Fructobacillus apis TaxID=2935017 RepID=A0ABT0ZP54_9LACO|nr:hypothetical protein [Fructobacillus apis]MCO0831774.1 hypothetical protein [Fructobacillus apis]